MQQEREAVARAREQAPKRIGHIRVDTAELDFRALDRFLASTRVFPSYSLRDREKVQPFLEAFRTAGFQVFDQQSIRPGAPWLDVVHRELKAAATDGWVLVFISAASTESAFVQMELAQARQMRARLILVGLESGPPSLADGQWFDATVDSSTAPLRLVNELLTLSL